MSALDDVYCIGNNEYKSMRTLINSYRELESVKNPVIDDQTIMFWNLQLQLFEMHERVLGRMFLNGRANGVMVDNEHTQKMIKLSNRAVYDGLSEDDRLCLATHLSLQLSGLV